MGKAFGQVTTAMQPYPYYPPEQGYSPMPQTPITRGQKKLISLSSLPLLIALGYGGLILTRIFKASKTEEGAGESPDVEEKPDVFVPDPTDPRCKNIEDQLNTPAGCKLVKALAYNRGERAQVVLQELPGRPGFYLQKSPIDAYSAFLKMEEAIKQAGIKVTVNSAFRAMAKQKQLYSLYLKGKGALAAKPGRSNHQYGTTVDLAVAANPKLFSWLMANGNKYGFYKTVAKENWHWEYKGK